MAERPTQKAIADFIAESNETIEALDKGLVLLDDTRSGGEPDPEVLNSVFRAAHTLKGLAAMFGVERLALLAHALEDRLDALRMGRCALDEATLGTLLATPAVCTRLVAEEGSGHTPTAGAEAEALAARLRGQAAGPTPAAADPIDELELQAGVREVLTEYEEHRLRASLQKGLALHRVRIGFELATFDVGLEELKKRLKPGGEVVATLPSAEPTDPNVIAFDLLFASSRSGEETRSLAGPQAVVEEIPRRAPGGAPRPAPAAALPAPSLAGAPPAASPAPARGPSAPARLAPAEPGQEPGPPAAAPTGDFSLRSTTQAVRVDIAKLDSLMNLVGELVLVKTSLLAIAERLRSGEESSTLGLELHRQSRALDRKLDELQGGILEVRMVPLEQTFEKLSRMVRKLARDLGKQVTFEVRGADVELDKLIVENLSDPLMHLIRNALDHAVEPPEARRAAGKPASGRVTLTAAQKGNHAVISVEDDGAGIDEDRVREVAVRRGIVSAEAAAELSRREVYNLLFVPGFSTASAVTALSGRGVGMDVVKANVAAMSGIIDLHSEPGRGTRVELTLPLTLAIIRALVVAAAERTYAVPLNSVLEVLTVSPAELRTIEQREVLNLRGSTLPLIRLGQFFGTAPAAPSPRPGPIFVVVVGLAQERLGVAVDGLVGQQDIVVKPLGKALAGVRGIAGATDLGHRRTILVLDVGAIIAEVVHGETAAAEAV